MANNPINLTVRFFLELGALYAMGYWGWVQHTGILKWFLMIGLPLLAAIVWGTFRVPNDPKVPPIQVSGIMRLIIEFIFFGGAILLLSLAARPVPTTIFGGLVIVHYLFSYDRIIWLLRQ